MKDVCVCFIGTKETAKLLGVEATVSDLEFRHYTKGDKTLTTVRPIDLSKFKTIVQAVNMSEYVLVEVTEVNKELGEIIILLDLMQKKGRFIIQASKQYLSEQVKGFGLDYEFTIINDNEDIKGLKEELIKIEPSYGDKTLVIIDHSFNVKNVGTVALGFVKGGVIHAKDKIKLLPGGKDVQINSVQSMDINYKELGYPSRVGLALKNCDIKDLERGSVLSNDLTETSELSGEITYSRYYKGDLKSAMVINGLLARQAEFKDKIILEKSIVITGPTIIYKDDISPRIIGIVK